MTCLLCRMLPRSFGGSPIYVAMGFSRSLESRALISQLQQQHGKFFRGEAMVGAKAVKASKNMKSVLDELHIC